LLKILTTFIVPLKKGKSQFFGQESESGHTEPTNQKSQAVSAPRNGIPALHDCEGLIFLLLF